MSDNVDQPDTIEVSLIDSIEKADIKDIAIDAAELTLDTILGDQLLQAIPIVSTVVRIYRTSLSIRDCLFLKKVLSFLTEITDASQRERERFTAQLAKDEGTAAKAGAALTLLLERLDDLDKPKIIGRLYRARLEKQLSFLELRRFCMIVERAYLPDLIALIKLPVGGRVDNIAAPHLHALGLVSITGEDYGTIGGIGAETWYEVNELGKKFLAIAFS